MTIWAGYDRGKLRSDTIAALTVAAISLPQGMAYAVLAGVDPRFSSPISGSRQRRRCFCWAPWWDPSRS